MMLQKKGLFAVNAVDQDVLKHTANVSPEESTALIIVNVSIAETENITNQQKVSFLVLKN